MANLRAALCAGAAGLAMAWGSTATAAEVAAADAGANEVDGLTVTGAYVSEPMATKMDVPALETPQAVSVITAQTLKDKGVTRLADALRDVAGVTRSSTYGFYDSYQIRGYDAAYGSLFLDGLTSGNVAGAVNELAGLDQVEVVKGPASALFGASPLGGVINLVSKRPTGERFLEIGVGTGSFDERWATIDANAPLTADGALLGRLNLIYRDSDDFVDFSHTQRIYVAPALTWVIGPDTKLTILARHQRDYDNPWSPVSAWGTILPNVHGNAPISFSVNNPGVDEVINNINRKQIGYVFDHAFSDKLKLTQNLRYEVRKTYWDKWMFLAGFLDDNVVGGVQQGRTLGRYYYGAFSQEDKEFGVDTKLTWKFETGAITHNLLAGVDYRRATERHNDTGSNFDPFANPLDLYAPDYAAPLIIDPLGAYEGSAKTSQIGFYLHDHVSLGERLTLTLGGRWDTAKSGDQEDSKFSPAVGATWALAPDASLYASYSKSFTPTPSWQTKVDGSLLPPETGENIEGGLKVVSKRFGGLSGMASVYQLTRQNVATEDPAAPFFFITTGEQRSRGVELEGRWTPIQPVELTAAYSHIDAKITKDNSFPVGIPLANFPENSVNLWGRYTFQDGPLARLGISVGMNYLSDRHFYEVYDGRVYALPAYTLWDIGLNYAYRDWNAQLTFNNITDERFFPDACCIDRVTPGEPYNWHFALRRMF